MNVFVEAVRLTAITGGLFAAFFSLVISVRYAKQALQVGTRQLFRDIVSLRHDSLLPVHVAVVSFVFAGFLLGDCVELAFRFGEPASWRLVYLPLNLLAIFSIVLVTIFVQNKGERVVPRGRPAQLKDRADGR